MTVIDLYNELCFSLTIHQSFLLPPFQVPHGDKRNLSPRSTLRASPGELLEVRAGRERHTAPRHRVKPLLTSLPSCVRSQHIHANSLINLYFAQLSNFFRPIAYGCLILEKRDNGICQSQVSSAASNGMGDGGGGLPRVHRRRSVEFRQQQPVLPGTGGYAVGPEPWEAGWAGGCVVPWGCVVAGGEPVCSWA